MDPLFEYSETGRPLRWYYYIFPVFLLLGSLSGLILNYSSIGSECNFVSLLYIVAIIAWIIFSIQISILPVLTLKAFPDRIVITNSHGQREMQKWVIRASEIGKGYFLEASPCEGIQIDNPYVGALGCVGDEKWPTFQHVISVRSHSSAILIESISENWLLGLDKSRQVIHELIQIYQDRGIYDFQVCSREKPSIVIRKIRMRHFKPVRQPLFFVAPLLFVTMGVPAVLARNDGSLPWTALAIYVLGVICMLAFPFIKKKISEVTVLRAYEDRLEIRQRKPRGKFTTIMADELRDIGTIHVEFGNYLNIPDYVQCFRVRPLSGPHKAVTIVTDKVKYAMDMPHPEDAAEALRKLYNLAPNEPERA